MAPHESENYFPSSSMRMRESCDFNQLLMFDQCKMGKKRNLTASSLIDDLAKTAKLPTIVIPANAGIQRFQLIMDVGSIPV
jgi:hypothetical protein